MKKIVFLGLLLSAFNVFGQADPLEKIFKNPEFAPVLRHLSVADYDSCLIFLSKFDSSHIDFNTIVLLKSQCHWELRDFEGLKQDLGFIIPITTTDDPNYSNLLNLYGLALKNTGNKEAAVATFQKGYQITGDLIHLTNLISIHNDLEEYKKSLKYKSEVRNDETGQLHFLMGEAYFRLGVFKKAESHLMIYQKLTTYGPNMQSYMYLGEIGRKDVTKSCNYFNKAKQLLEQIPTEIKTENKMYFDFENILELELKKCS